MDGSGARASQAFRERTRSTNPCDGCALRRVRCDGGRPCKECQKRLLTCTTLRITRKRGPKGPRQSTSQKVRHLQRQLQLANSAEVSVRRRDGATSQPTSPGASSSFASPHFQRSSLLISGPSPKYRPLPLETYCKFLGIFQERLYSVWPVLDCSGLITRLVNDEHDHEAWTLAASVCAGVIAQLRLPEHRQVTTPSLSASTFSKVCQTQAAISVQTTCQHFNADTTHFRALCDYRERPSIFSLLSSFFLHIYCANSDLLSTAGFHLRDSLTQAHMLGLHRPNTYAGLSADERELRLRVYWVLFVSERTYCIQHSLPTILRPINQHPSPNKGPDGYTDNAMVSFLYLTKLFTFLDEDLIESHSTSSIMAIGNGGAGDSVEKERARNKVTLFQSDLGSATKGVGLDETQKVDIFITRNWIRILLWQYTIRHFTMSYTTDDQAFSLLLPALVAHEMLGLFSAVSPKSICAHGYGMELKVFSITNSLLDVLVCGRPTSRTDSMLFGSRDALHTLEKVLATIGGADSIFLGKLRQRMSEVQLPVTSSSWLQLPWLEESNDSGNIEHPEGNGSTFLEGMDINAAAEFELDEADCSQFGGTTVEDLQLLNSSTYAYNISAGSQSWDEIIELNLEPEA